MARKIKFALEMADGTKVRSNLEELREHFDLESIMGYFLSGKLQEWLEDRYYEKEAEQLASLNKDASDIYAQVCTILSIEPPINDNLNIDSIERLNEKKALLRQVTTDEEIIEHAAQVAFDQEELADLIESDIDTIYLCGKKFSISSKIANKTYIGVNNPQISINVKSFKELKEKAIIIKEAILPDHLSVKQEKETHQSTIDMDLQALSLYERTKHLYGEEEANAEKMYLECKYDGLFEKFISLANKGVERAKYFVVQMCCWSYGDAPLEGSIDNEYRKSCLESSDILAKINGIYMLPHDTGEFSHEIDKLYLNLKKIADEGDPFACNEMGALLGNGYHKISKEEANEYVNRAHDLGNTDATIQIANLARANENYEKAKQYFEIASELGNPTAQNYLGVMYHNGEGVKSNVKKANSLFRAAAKKHNAYANNNLGNSYRYGYGVKVNMDKAYVYYCKAANKNCQPSIEIINDWDNIIQEYNAEIIKAEREREEAVREQKEIVQGLKKELADFEYDMTHSPFERFMRKLF